MRPTRALYALLACLVALAPAAQAIYVVTPLHAFASHPSANVGDAVDITVQPDPENASARDAWAGKTVHAYYAYDARSPDEPVGPDEAADDTYRRILITDALALDDQTRASFSWTVVPEVDDRNVQILIESPDGELLAHANIAVGDAPPQLMAASGGAAEPGSPVETPMETGQDGGAKDESAGESNVPAPGAVALLALVGLAAMALRRR